MTTEQKVVYLAGASDALAALGLRCPAAKTYAEQHAIMETQILGIRARGKRMNLVSAAESLLVNLRSQGCVIEKPDDPTISPRVLLELAR